MTGKRGDLHARRQAAAFLFGPALAGIPAGRVAAAEEQLRIAKQSGVVYLPLNVAEDQKPIEKHGEAAGISVAAVIRIRSRA